MNTIQKNILNQYREIFPNDKLKDYSSKTGIQITRVHRIINGAEMKISELEAFERAIASNSFITDDFLKVAFECIKKLNSKKLKYYQSQMQHALKLDSLSQTQIQTQLFELRLA